MADTLRSELLLTDRIRKCIRTVLTKESLPNEIREQLRQYASNRANRDAKKTRTIPYEVVQKLHQYLVQSKSGQGESIYLHELLEGSDVHLPEHEEPPRSAELEARIQRLKAEQSNREYRAMTKNVDSRTSRDNDMKDFGKEVKEMNNQLLAVFNFLVTVGGAFVFGYKMWDFTAEESPPMPMKLCSGLVLGTIVFFADLYFLLRQTT